jgi:hypothetical protein
MKFSNELSDEEVDKLYSETFGSCENTNIFHDRIRKLTHLTNAFLTLFGDSIYIGTRRIGGTVLDGRRTHLYLPKEFCGHPVTLIVWPKGQFNFAKERIKNALEPMVDNKVPDKGYDGSETKDNPDYFKG